MDLFSFRMALWVLLAVMQRTEAAFISTQAANKEKVVTKVFVTLVGAGGCTGGVYRTNTHGGPCEFWYSMTCGSSQPDFWYQNLLQGPTTLNVGYMSISPAYSQNQTCTLYGFTSGRCLYTIYDIESSSQFSTPSTVSASFYTTLTPGDFAVVPITAVNGNTGLLSSVARCVSTTVSSPATSAGTNTASNTDLTSTGAGNKTDSQNAQSTSTNDHGASGLSSGAKAGIGVGVGVGGAIVLGIGALLLRRRRKQHRSPSQPLSAPGNGEVGVGKAGDPPLHELGQEEKEMPTGKEAHEMLSETTKTELAATSETARYELAVTDVPKAPTQ